MYLFVLVYSRRFRMTDTTASSCEGMGNMVCFLQAESLIRKTQKLFERSLMGVGKWTKRRRPGI